MPQPDPDDWQHWLARYKAGLFLLARQHLANTHEAEDAVQEGFVKFWLARKTARDPAAYLFACVRTAAIDLRRSRTARHRREQSVSSANPSLFQPSQEHDESRQQIEAALPHLAPEQREVLVLKIWSDLTFAQIAATLHISQNTAASRYRYALEHLQNLLAPKVHHE